MILSSLAPLVFSLLPFVSATPGVHRLKLKKIPPVSNNPALESAYLAQKYGGSRAQIPLMGAGGAGRQFDRPTQQNGEDLFWTQEEFNDGHGVPLTSMFG